MRKFIEILFEITTNAANNVLYFVKSNLVTFANILNLSIPFVMYFLGRYLLIERGNQSIGGELLIPVLLYIIIYYLKSVANMLGKGITIPLPNKRFTEVDEDGEVSIRNDRLQELILYVADLEDWLEKKGLL